MKIYSDLRATCGDKTVHLNCLGSSCELRIDGVYIQSVRRMQLGSLIGFLRRIRQLQSFLLEERLTLLIVLNSAKIACIGLRARPGLFSLVARLGGVEVRPLSLVRSLLSRRVG